MQAAATAAEKMDAIYRRQRFIYDATRRYYLLGRDRLIGSLKPPLGGAVLEVGCGTARNLIRAAKRYPGRPLLRHRHLRGDAQVGADFRCKGGLRSRVALGQGDATAFQPAALFGRDAFDRIYISYSLSMIPPWQDALKHAMALLAPRGELHIVDFGEFAGYPALVRHAQLAWLRRFSVVPIPGMQGKIAALAGEAGLTATAERLYGGYAIQMRLCR